MTNRRVRSGCALFGLSLSSVSIVLTHSMAAQSAARKVTASAGRWTLSRTVDPLNDSATVSASVDANEAVRTLHRVEKPLLRVSCDLEDGSRQLNVMIYSGSPSNEESIEVRVDKEPAFRMGTIPSRDHTSLFLSNDDDSFAKAAAGIATGQKLLVRFTPFASGPVVLSFPIDGGAAVMGRMKQAGCQMTGNAHAARGLSPRDSTVPVNTDQPYFEFQVEKQVQQIPGTGNLRYPDMLRSANIEGEVLAQFVVDANGHFEAGSLHVLHSTHELFTQAVRNALPNMRFYPAEVGGKKVRQLVQQPFTFSLAMPHQASPDYPPQPIELFLPPLPAPSSTRGFHFVAEFDVDSTGRVLACTFTPTPDAAYNKRIDDVLRTMRFRPATRADGTPTRGKATLGYEF